MKYDKAFLSTMRSRARRLRLKPTGAEARFWSILKHIGVKRKRRQFVIGKMIIDFAIPSRNLLVEIDGTSHIAKKDKDARRDAWLREVGFQLLRVPNTIVFENPEEICRLLHAYESSEQNRNSFVIACRVARRKAFIVDEEPQTATD